MDEQSVFSSLSLLISRSYPLSFLRLCNLVIICTEKKTGRFLVNDESFTTPISLDTFKYVYTHSPYFF